MPGTLWSTLRVLIYLILITNPEASTIIILILKMTELRHRMVKYVPKVTQPPLSDRAGL